MKTPWVFVDSLNDGTIPVSSEELKHLAVRRVRDGDRVLGFDGSGKIAVGKLFKGNIKVEKVLEFRRVPPLFVPVFPVISSAKMDVFFRTVPFFDVERVLLFVPERGEVKKVPGKEKLGRWKRVMISSCKQCMNPYLPEISVTELGELSLSDGEAGVFLDEMEMDRGVGDELFYKKRRVFFVVGPEGGFSGDEVDILVKKGFRPITLGIRIFPSEFAPFFFLSIASFLKGTASRIRRDEREFFFLFRHTGR